MRKFLMFAVLPAMGLLSACQDLPPDLVVVGCATGPALIPELAEEIATACALHAASTVMVDPSGLDPAQVAAATAAAGMAVSN